ncbi:MAG: DUF4386 family protein [Anaerolineae bacterium]|nr:DUF4386 family protein [Anaerolineae bacterium]
MMTQNAAVQIEDSAWKVLYRIGGVAALIAAFGFRRNIGAEVSLASAQMPPATAGGWFDLLQSRRFIGLAYLNLFDLVNYALLGLLFIALYVALRQINRSATLIALCSGLMGVAVYFASNQVFAILSLSNQYAAAAEADRAAFLAAGEALLAVGNQGAGVYLGLFLVTFAALMFSVVMLRGGVFSRLTAYIGIVGNACILCYFATLIFAPALTWLPHTVGAIPLVVWEVLAGLRLLKMARA